MIKRFLAYYTVCRNKGGVLYGLEETSRWHAFKFACHMTMWSITDSQT